MDNNRKYVIPESVIFARVCDLPMLAATRQQFNETDVAACVLNETGEFIWELVGQGCTFGEILRRTEDHFDADREMILRQVTDFLEILERQRFLLPCEE